METWQIIGLVLCGLAALVIFIPEIIYDIQIEDSKKSVIFTIEVCLAVKNGSKTKEEFEKEIKKTFLTKQGRMYAKEILDKAFIGEHKNGK